MAGVPAKYSVRDGDCGLGAGNLRFWPMVSDSSTSRKAIVPGRIKGDFKLIANMQGTPTLVKSFPEKSLIFGSVVLPMLLAHVCLKDRLYSLEAVSTTNLVEKMLHSLAP